MKGTTKMYAVVERWENYVTVVMVLTDREKAEKLADFLNQFKYFTHIVTVESYPEFFSHQDVWKAIENEH